MESCIVLNADYTYINTVSWKKAIKLVINGKAEALKYSNKVLTNFENTIIMKVPSVMKLLKLVRTIYKTKVPFSKKNVLIRDGFKCLYCGSKSHRLTIDHVVPVSRGGKSNFENCVAACRKCNNKKGSRTASEARMYLQKQPYAPTISEFIMIKIKSMGIYQTLKDLGVY